MDFEKILKMGKKVELEFEEKIEEIEKGGEEEKIERVFLKN